MVVLDEGAKVIRPTLLWNDLRSAGDGRALLAGLGPLADVAAGGDRAQYRPGRRLRHRLPLTSGQPVASHVVTAVLGHVARLPKIARPAQIVGRTSWGAALAARTATTWRPRSAWTWRRGRWRPR